jgi:hypothetical protein
LTLPESGRYDPAMTPASVLRAVRSLFHGLLPSRFRGAVLAVALAALLISCGAPCGTENRRTEESLAKARTARADIYAPAAYAKAAGMAGTADAECRGQERRFFPMRSFSRALELHAGARQAAERAENEARINQGMIRQEALNARYLAIQSVEDARAAIARARKAKGSGVEDLAEGWTRLRDALSEVQRRIDRSDPLSARDLAERIARESSLLQGAANSRARGLPAPAPAMDGLY